MDTQTRVRLAGALHELADDIVALDRLPLKEFTSLTLDVWAETTEEAEAIGLDGAEWNRDSMSYDILRKSYGDGAVQLDINVSLRRKDLAAP